MEDKYKRELDFLRTNVDDIRFIIIMMTNFWKISEPSYFLDYFYEYLSVIKHPTQNSRYYNHFFDEIYRALVREGYMKVLGSVFGEPNISLTIRGCWYLHVQLRKPDISTLLDHYYIVHGSMLTAQLLHEKYNMGINQWYGVVIADKCVYYEGKGLYGCPF